jgi:subfamily B ATP-binding cassette protein MsbA
MEGYEVDRFRRENESYYQVMKKAIRLNELASPLLEFVGAFGIAAVVWYGGLQVIEGKTTVGSFFSFMTALFMLFAPISKLARANNKVQQALGASHRIFELLDAPPEITDRKEARDLPPLRHQIEYRDVSFRYNSEPVLSGISLTIPKGTVTALVGLSGAGKSTFVDLIPRFYDVNSGGILIDGTDIRDVRLSSLRGQIGIVTQEIFLFNDTIRNNICYGHAESGEDRMVEAAKTAYAHDFILNFPEGYDTRIGERGLKLSGGERQRLSIARAILKNPEILILDEATSSLDSESETMVQKALNNLMRNRTTVVIAHRLSTIVNADRIVVLDGGRIAEVGTHKELLERNGLYRKIYHLQFETPRLEEDSGGIPESGDS